MPQIVKVQVSDFKNLACLAECAANGSGLIWKHPVVIMRLPAYDLPRFVSVFETSDLISLGGVLQVSDCDSLKFFIVIAV